MDSESTTGGNQEVAVLIVLVELYPTPQIEIASSLADRFEFLPVLGKKRTYHTYIIELLFISVFNKPSIA